MSFRIAAPSPLLSPYVQQYWSMEATLGNGESCIQRIVPGGLTELIFYLEDVPGYIKGGRDIPGRVITSGQQTGYYDIEVAGKMSLFSVLFRPEGLKSLFRLPPEELADRTIDATHLIGREAYILYERLAEAESFQSRKEIADNFLLKHLCEIGNHSMLRITDSIRAINTGRAMIGVDKLADRACLSIRQYERQFSSCIGVTPVQFLRIVRFQNTIHTRGKNPEISLTSLAADCGYYDQSHMISEFRKLSGLTPREFFSNCDSTSDYFAEIGSQNSNR